jgi:hypothetical protein
MVAAVPPSVVRVPAAFSLRVQVPSPLIRLTAVLAMLANCLIEFRLRALDLTLALGVIVRRSLGYGNQRRHTQITADTASRLRLSSFKQPSCPDFGPACFDWMSGVGVAR